MSSSPDYHHRVNPDLLRRIPCNAATVLEIGCAAGQLGAAYKSLNPACRYLGVELDAAAAGEAERLLDKVWAGDVEKFQPKKLGLAPQSLDCLIYGDILEHLADPWTVLSRHVPLLKDDGVLLACIPNVQHWSILADLMQGRWQYRDEGLLDRTHLRFFTLESVLDMLRAAGLAVLDVQARRFNEKAFAAFYCAVEPALINLGIDRARFQAQAGAMQYVVRATRVPVASPLLVHSLMLKPVAACNDVRIMHVNACLATIPGVSVLQEVLKADLSPGVDGDKIFVWQRPILTHDDRARLEAVVKAGYVVVVEFDDHPMRWPAIAQNDYLTYRGVHAVQTSTPVLGEFYRQFNPEVRVFSNQIRQLPPWREPAGGDAPLTVFFGALNREDDWKALMPQLNQAIRRNPGRMRFEVIHDRLFFDALETQEKRFTPTCPYPRYCELLAGSDIALLPLQDTEFNRMKSDLKFIEAAAHGAVALASPTVYRDTLEDGVTGLLFSDANEFSGRLQQLLEDADLRLALRRHARQYVVSRRMLAPHVPGRLEWYRHLLRNREELEEQRKARIASMPS